MSDTARTLIVVPTYNEVENISLLYSQIKKYVPEKHILFVDDNSSDGTIEAIKKIMDLDSNVHILVRQAKQGIAKAYLAGFQWGLERGYDWFQELDADLSHEPKYLLLFDRFKSEYDVIVASRYIEDGVARKWNLGRRFISYCGCRYLKLLFGSELNDWTGGFNCWKRSVLENIDLSRISSKGFIFQSELKFVALRTGARAVEFPFVFKEREKGKSKLSLNIIIEGLLKPCLLKFNYRKIKNRKSNV